MAIPVERTVRPRPRPPEGALGFGRFFTDHLFRADWDEESGWHSARVVPYGPIALDPAASALHYGQALFEGLKAFRARDGGMFLFRPRAYLDRLNRSARRLAMPEIAPEIVLEGAKTLLRVDASWMPSAPTDSIYLRPVMFATEPFLGVRPSKSFALLVIASPVGGYFSGPPRPLRIWVEEEKARAARGGIGAAKAAANYVASLLAAEEAKARGFDQVLWLDGAQHRDVEEIGTMNVFAKIGGTVVTPALQGSILPGVTRDCVIQLCRDLGIPVEERTLPFQELRDAHAARRLEEVFGTGTAALVAPIGELAAAGGSLAMPAPGPQSLGERLRAQLAAIQRREMPDRHGWLEPV